MIYIYLCNQCLDIFSVDYYNHLGWICVRFVQFKLVSFSLVFSIYIKELPFKKLSMLEAAIVRFHRHVCVCYYSDGRRGGGLFARLDSRVVASYS